MTTNNQEDASKISPFDNLPDEIIILILSYVLIENPFQNLWCNKRVYNISFDLTLGKEIFSKNIKTINDGENFDIDNWQKKYREISTTYSKYKASPEQLIGYILYHGFDILLKRFLEEKPIKDLNDLTFESPDPNPSNNEPLHLPLIFLAAVKSNENIINILLNEKPNLMNYPTSGVFSNPLVSHFNPIHLACCTGRKEIVKKLLDNLQGDDDKFNLLNISDDVITQEFIFFNQTSISIEIKYGGGLPLHIAVQKGHIDLVGDLLEYIKVTYNENDASGIINMQNTNGWTPFKISVAEDNLEITKLLIENGAKFNISWNQNNDNPLHFACKNELSKEMIEYLFKQNQDWVTQTNKNERTPVDIACYMNNIEAVKLFIMNGISIFSKNSHEFLSTSSIEQIMPTLQKNINEELKYCNNELKRKKFIIGLTFPFFLCILGFFLYDTYKLSLEFAKNPIRPSYDSIIIFIELIGIIGLGGPLFKAINETISIKDRKNIILEKNIYKEASEKTPLLDDKKNKNKETVIRINNG